MRQILLALSGLLLLPALWAQQTPDPQLSFLDIKTFMPGKKGNDIRCFYALAYGTKPERFSLRDSSTGFYTHYSWLIDTKQVIMVGIDRTLYANIDGKEVTFQVPHSEAPEITVKNKEYAVKIYCSTRGPLSEPVPDKLMVTDLKTRKKVLLSIVGDCL